MPQTLNFRRTFALFTRHDPDRPTGRRYSDTLKHYLDHGSLDVFVRQYLLGSPR